MKWIYSLLMLLACSLITSCTTHALWVATDPNEYVAVTKNIENETKLEAGGLEYCVDNERGLIYVEKNKLQKARDYTIRTLATPVTVAFDAATTIVIVGAAVYVLSHEVPDGRLEAAKREREQKEWDSLRTALDASCKDVLGNPNPSSGTGHALP